MNCKKFGLRICEYIDGNLCGKIKQQFENHAESCDLCRTRLNEMQDTVHLLQSVRQIDLPPLFHDRLKESLMACTAEKKEAEIIPFEKKERVRKPVFRKVLQTAGTLAACLLIVFGVILGGQRLLPPRSESDRTAEQNLFAMDMKRYDINDGTKEETIAMALETTVAATAPSEEAKNDEEKSEPIRFFTARPMTYEQKNYKIALITDQKEDIAEKVRNIAQSYQGWNDPAEDKTVNGNSLVLTISLPSQNYSSFTQELLALKKAGLVSGYIENELSIIDYGYEVQQIREIIEDLNNQIENIKENQPSNKALLDEKENELDKMNNRLVQLENEVQYANVTVEISEG
jgi:hypothetical protein